jgi:serine/threonine-protein kinase
MGKVWRARHTDLKRDDALKVLPDEFAADPERLARFQREAQVLASLNHPNIAHVYGLERADPSTLRDPQGRPESSRGATGAGQAAQALVMELVEGPTLADRITQGPIPLDEALPIAKQIAEALEAAHEQGIIHRDLKPANIKLRPDGTVKVLDFGLAKAGDSAPASNAALTHSPTLSMHATYAGIILGTAAYMSPEQAAGKAVDKRADIWSFGVVLWEMLTGRPLFSGETVSHTLADVLRAEIDFNALPSNTPLAIRTLLVRCLQRDAKRRLRDIGEARIAIENAETGHSQEANVTAMHPGALRWRPVMLMSISALLAGALGAVVAWNLRPASVPPTVTRFSFTIPQGQNFRETGSQLIAISPDGTRVAYVANQRLYLRSMSELEGRPIAGTDVVQGAFIGEPVFSPDGQSIAFWTGAIGNAMVTPGVIKRVAITGGTAVTIGSSTIPLGMSWGPEGIVFAEFNKGVMHVPANGGGQPELVLSIKDGLPWLPQILPGGDALLFSFAPGIANPLNVPPDAWDRASIVIHSLSSGERTTLPVVGAGATYVSTGHLVYSTGGTLFAVPFDLARRQVAGGPVPVVEGVRRVLLSNAALGTVYYSVSGTGALIYIPGPVSASSAQLDLAFVDAKGNLEPAKLRPAPYQFPRISPDGRRVAVGTDDGKEANVWIYDLSGANALRQLTFNGKNRFPLWSPDGQLLAFQSDREGDLGIFSQRADGIGPTERLTKPEQGTAHVPESWSPDGRTLLFGEKRDANISLWSLSLADKTTARFDDVQSTTEPPTATFSPDGRWVAYMSSDGTNRSIFVQPFPANGDKFRIAAGGWHPLWSPDGGQLSYRVAGGRNEIVRIMTRPSFTVGNPDVIGVGALLSRGLYQREYDITRDGKRFIGVINQSGFELSEVHVVQNWDQELKRLVPTN